MCEMNNRISDSFSIHQISQQNTFPNYKKLGSNKQTDTHNQNL